MSSRLRRHFAGVEVPLHLHRFRIDGPRRATFAAAAHREVLNVGLTPSEVVEDFIQLTFYVGVSATEAALRITKAIFEERGIQFTPVRVYDTNRTTKELYQAGLQSLRTHQR